MDPSQDDKDDANRRCWVSFVTFARHVSSAHRYGDVGQILLENSTGAAYAPQTAGGDATLSSSGALTVTATNGCPVAPLATTDAANASNISSGTLAPARHPDLSPNTLGGVRIVIAQTHKWINAISTSGTPIHAQPASTDLSDLPIPACSGGPGQNAYSWLYDHVLSATTARPIRTLGGNQS